MLAGALLLTWHPLPLPLCLGLAAASFFAFLAFAAGVSASGLVVGLAFTATFPSLMRAALPENGPLAHGALLAGRYYIAIPLRFALRAALGASV
jgi:hypothetical protein